MTKRKNLVRTSPKNILWITDPWETLDHPRDTTLRLAEEFLTQGIFTFWASVSDISWKSGRVQLLAQKIEQIYPGRLKKSFRLSAPEIHSPLDFDQIHYRTDPPLDHHYFHPLQLLKMGTEMEAKKNSPLPEWVNPLEILFQKNEKFEAAWLGELMPESLISSQPSELESFGRQMRKTVLKPLHEAQSKGIELLEWHSQSEMQSSLEKIKNLSQNFTLPVLLQTFLPGIARGEKRLWFVDGELLATILKLPPADDFRINMDNGSRLAPTELDADEKNTAKKIGQHLKRNRIRLAAVDLIDGKITDTNFTSPGLLPQMEGVLGTELASKVVQALLQPMV